MRACYLCHYMLDLQYSTVIATHLVVRSCIARNAGRLVLLERRPGVFGRYRYPLLDAAEAVQRGSDIEREDRRAVWLGRSRVVVDHVAHFFACTTSTNDPVMAIEGWLRAARKSVRRRGMEIGVDVLEASREQPACEQPETGLWRELARTSLEPCQLQILTPGTSELQDKHIIPARNSRVLLPLPLQDLLPRLLVQEVMYLHHHLNVLLRGLPALAYERVVELLR